MFHLNTTLFLQIKLTIKSMFWLAR